MIFKTLIFCTRNVVISTEGAHPYTYTSEQTAYSDYQYFGSVDRAKAFVQGYSPDHVLEWELTGDDCWCTKTDAFSANVYIEKQSSFDPVDRPALPSKYHSRPDRD